MNVSIINRDTYIATISIKNAPMFYLNIYSNINNTGYELTTSAEGIGYRY